MKAILKHLRVAFVAGVVSIWAAGFLLHDTWLRPWSTIIGWCLAYSVALVAVLLIGRYGGWIAAGIAAVSILILGVPTVSVQRKVTIENQCQSPIEVRLHSLDGRREKGATLSPKESWGFVYFVGDVGRVNTIPSRIEVRRISDASVVSRRINLPIGKPGLKLEVTDDWFLTAGKKPDRGQGL